MRSVSVSFEHSRFSISMASGASSVERTVTLTKEKFVQEMTKRRSRPGETEYNNVENSHAKPHLSRLEN